MNIPLTDAEIGTALRGLPGWSYQRSALEREYQFADFRAAIAFMVRASFEAEAVNHHPGWTNVFNRVNIRLTTHDAGGRVTAKDVDLARRFDAAAGV
ncbi:MAG: 4a-hydroxytetrahydrobiopterin dehydratase [Opitutaceae bacterium]